MSNDGRIAPEGCIWVCHACGKMSKDQFGYSEEYPESSLGWDASCVLNSKCYKIKDLKVEMGLHSKTMFEGRVTKITGEPVEVESEA